MDKKKKIFVNAKIVCKKGLKGGTATVAVEWDFYDEEIQLLFVSYT